MCERAVYHYKLWLFLFCRIDYSSRVDEALIERVDEVGNIYRAMLQASLDAHHAMLSDMTEQIRKLQRDKADVERQNAALVEELRRYTRAKIE